MQDALKQIGDEAYWRVVGASVQGSVHREKEVPCQDAYNYRVLGDGTLLIVVADGAGSAPQAARGAHRAVEQAMDSLALALKAAPTVEQAGWEHLLAGVFLEARQALAELAKVKHANLSDYATTLTCTIVSPEWLATGQVGDGVVVAREKDHNLFNLIRPQRGEYANETTFLSMENALESIQVKVLNKPIREVVVMSDGLLRLAMKLPNYQPHEPFFDPLLAFVADSHPGDHPEAQLARFLASERVCARTEDDKTLVVAVQVSSPGKTALEESPLTSPGNAPPQTDCGP